MVSALIHRFNSGNYTDADIQAYLVQRRSRASSYALEIGNFVAHPDRDKGDAFNIAIRIFSQFAFFYRYRNKEIDPNYYLSNQGKCEWWFRPWLLSQVDIFPDRHIRHHLGVTSKKLRQEIEAWFPKRRSPYPTEINCPDAYRFFDIVNLLSSVMGGNAAYSIQDAWKSIALLLQQDGIDTCIERFIVGSAVTMAKASVILPEFTRGSVDLSIQSYTTWYAEPPRATSSEPRRMFLSNPHGTLKAGVMVKSLGFPGGVGTDIIDFEIDTQNYFCPNFITKNHNGLRYYDMTQSIAFDASRDFPVYSI